MPFSDDLYSGDVEYPDVDYPDVDSFSDELSPADGYFERAVPSGGMVPDPSQVSDDKTVEDKVLITRPEPRTAAGSSSRPTNSPTLEQLHPTHNNASAATSPTVGSPVAPSSFNRIHPDVLIMGAIAPPPAYSASPPPTSSHAPSSPQSPQEHRSYNTFHQPHLEHRLEQGFLPTRHPENMGRPEGEPNEEVPLVSIRVERKSRRRTVLRKLLFAALVLAVMTSVLTAALHWDNSDSHKRPSKDMEPLPRVPGGPGRPYCSSATYSKDPIAYTFPLGGDLTVIQRTRDDNDLRGSRRVETMGEIRFRRLQKGSPHGDGKGYTTVEINVSHPDIEVQWELEQESRFLAVTTPRYARLDIPGRHCVSLDIVVWLPEDAALTSISVSAITLALKVLDDIRIDVSGLSELVSISGNIDFPAPSSTNTHDLSLSQPEFRFHSRRLDVETISGDIRGRYPLLDHLGISSQSGKIGVTVWPHGADPSDPAPADLDVHTTSGDINVNLPVVSNHNRKFTPPPRDYTTKVTSSSGDLSGTFYLGSSGTFETISGDIKARILPIVQSGPSDDPDKDSKVTLKTETISGRTEVEIIDPIFIAPIISELLGHHHQSTGDRDSYLLFSYVSPSDPTYTLVQKLRCLQSSHITKSANIDVHYPDAWEGTFTGKTFSGDISVEGKDLRVIKSNKGYVGKELLARKGVDTGDFGSFAVMHTISGDLRFIAESSGH